MTPTVRSASLEAPALPESRPTFTAPPPAVTEQKPPILQDQRPGDPVEESQPSPDLPRDVKPNGQLQNEAKYKFNLESAPLKTVLQAVAAQAGLKLDIAPGLGNPTVNVNIEGQSGIEVLEKLGKQYGFTPFAQGGKSVLIIPAADGAGPTDTPVGG
jgi:hypothetical protein